MMTLIILLVLRDKYKILNLHLQIFMSLTHAMFNILDKKVHLRFSLLTLIVMIWNSAKEILKIAESKYKVFTN